MGQNRMIRMMKPTLYLVIVKVAGLLLSSPFSTTTATTSAFQLGGVLHQKKKKGGHQQQQHHHRNDPFQVHQGAGVGVGKELSPSSFSNSKTQRFMVPPKKTTSEDQPPSSPSKKRNTRSSEELNEIYGTGGRGITLFVIILSICIWFFTIPPEFRRSKICNEEDSAMYSQCKTTTQFVTEIQNYYNNGGGIQWDFSIDPNTKK